MLKFAKNRYSQNGEDGILAEIFRRLKIKSGWFVEFGAWDGIHMSNTYALLRKGWKGVDIEGEADRYKDLLVTKKKYPRQLHTILSFVADKGPNSLDKLLADTPIPKDFELLSIDIDSFDWYIWKALKTYSPKVVVIEINSSIPLGQIYVQPYGITYEKLEASGRVAGSSFSAMLQLAQSKGYVLVAHTGNMIFVRQDLIDQLKLPQAELDNPNALFLDDWVESKSRLSRLAKKVQKRLSK